jgi:hypothetical protein
LLKKIRHIQEACQDVIEGPVERKLKRQLGHYKNRMYQCTKQEKTILARLGEVTYEIQSKERWNRIENERLQQWNCHEFEQVSFDAAYPEFTPQYVYPQQWSAQSILDSRYYAGSSHLLPTHEVALEWYAPTIRCEPTEVHELPCVMTSPISNRVRSASMVNLTLSMEKVKRLSMPELSTEEDDYIGHDISKTALMMNDGLRI